MRKTTASTSAIFVQDVVIHGDKSRFFVYDKSGGEYSYTAREFAEMIRSSKNYTGKKIRLISCEVAAEGANAAQALADELGVEIMAPNDVVWNETKKVSSMINVGQIQEITHNPAHPSIYALISNVPSPHKKRVLDYLRKNRKLAIAPGPSYDVITGERIPGQLSTNIDGTYYWRSDVSYYFEKYNLVLPDDFIQLVIRSN